MNNRQDIDIFIAVNANKFPDESLLEIRNMLYQVDVDTFRRIHMVSYKDPSSMLVISIFAGKFGVDRFMLGQTALGIVKLLTCGGLGIWTIIDIFVIGRAAKEYNLEKLREMLQFGTENYKA